MSIIQGCENIPVFNQISGGTINILKGQFQKKNMFLQPEILQRFLTKPKFSSKTGTRKWRFIHTCYHTTTHASCQFILARQISYPRSSLALLLAMTTFNRGMELSGYVPDGCSMSSWSQIVIRTPILNIRNHHDHQSAEIFVIAFLARS